MLINIIYKGEVFLRGEFFGVWGFGVFLRVRGFVRNLLSTRVVMFLEKCATF